MPQPSSGPALVGIFHAFADPTRLAVVERLSIAPASASELAKGFAMALPSFMQHMGVLERNAIVTSRKHGRVRTYQLAPGALQVASAWLMEFRNHWERKLGQLDLLLTSHHPQGSTMNRYTPDPILDLVLDRTIAVAPERVWAAWTDPALLMQWFTPAPWKTVSADLDVRPGGRCATTMESPEGDRYPTTGCYLQVEPHRLLVFTSVMTDDFRPATPGTGAGDLAFTARIELDATPDGGTHYRAVAMHASEETCKQHADMGFADGWGAALDQLVTLVS
jgi:uncharacterized protein YndB with AHSA1/START domain/DNA-binding transcriptional ArsR family regulator